MSLIRIVGRIAFYTLIQHAIVAYVWADDGSAEQLLQKVDGYRNFKNTAFSFDLELISRKEGKRDKTFGMHAKVLDAHTSFIAYHSPKREQGKALLTNGHHLWFVSRTAKKPIRITPQQRLLGEASNGDVASTDFSSDYIPVYAEPDIKMESHEVVLELNAKPESLAAYHRILLWVNKDNHRPIKAQFFTESGKHLKSAFYTQFSKLEDFDKKPQLVEVEIHNAISNGSITIMRYSNFSLETLEKHEFQPAKIQKLLSSI